MKLKNDDRLRLGFAWQTVLISKLTASIPDGTELCCSKSFNLVKSKSHGSPKLHVKMFYCWFSFWILIKELAVHKKLLSPRLRSGACYTRFSVSRSLTAIWEKMRKTTNQEICFPKTFQSNWALTPSDGLLPARH